MARLYFEDLDIGATWELGSHEMTEAEITEFAERYDPQPFHVDEERAKASMFGGLIASGWHTAIVFIRLLTRHFLEETSHMAGKSVSNLRWHVPVRPGDTLTGTVEILGKSTSDRRPKRGYLDYRIVGENQDDDTVITLDLHGLFERRSPDEPT